MHLVVGALPRHELVVGPLLDYPPTCHDKYDIGVSDVSQALKKPSS